MNRPRSCVLGMWLAFAVGCTHTAPSSAYSSQRTAQSLSVTNASGVTIRVATEHSDPSRRPPIAQRRIIGISKQEIKFWAKDRKLCRQVMVRLTPKEFLAAWMQHIPERYKHAVRSFGLFAPRTIGDSSAAVSAILGQGPKRRPRPISWSLSIKRDFGWDPLLDVQGNRMTWIRRIAPQRA